jgi:threonine/homoserine/homoserine lactone efflux protein
MFNSMAGLFVATVVLGLSPGPAVFATVGRSLGTNIRSVGLFISGIVLGDLLFSMIAMLGLAGLAAAYAPLFATLKIAGGGYLVWLGAQSLRRSGRPGLKLEYDERGWQPVASGLMLTASNPKDLLFFVGFLPAFVNLKTPHWSEMIAASCVIVVAFLMTLSLYALAASRAREAFRNEKSIRALHAVAGLLMIGAGLFVVFM